MKDVRTLKSRDIYVAKNPLSLRLLERARRGQILYEVFGAEEI